MNILECIEVETGPNPKASVIWMHGLGADGHDFEPIVAELDLPAEPIRFIFPNAPMRPVTVNNGMVMRAWYDIKTFPVRREDEDGMRESQKQIEALIAREKTRGSPAMRIVLAGFSQGGAVALHTALRHPERLAGIMALSTYLPLAATVQAEATAINRDIPIFMAHGQYDPVIEINRATASRDALAALGYSVEWRDYPMEHSVHPREIADIGEWLQKVLG